MAKKEDNLEDKLAKLTKDEPTALAKAMALSAKAGEVGALSPAEMEEIEAEAAAEVARELKADQIKEFKAAAKQKLKKQTLFQAGKDEEGDDTEMVLITLAQHMPYIRLDSNIYYQGRAYRLGRKTAAVVKEQMFRGDMHEHEISGKNMKGFYGQRPQGLVINPNTPINLSH